MNEAVDQAERLLRDQWGSDLSLREADALASPHGLWRCVVDGVPALSSVIVKRVTATEFSALAGAESQRLLNEWACLEFLSDTGVTPTLLAAGGDPAVLVMEDLGAAPTVLEALRGEDAEAAESAVVGMASALAAMHRSSRGRRGAFDALQRGLGAASPRSDSTFDLRRSRSMLTGPFGAFGVKVTDGMWSEIVAVEQALHDDEVAHTFIHGDAGPQNCLVTPDGARFVDLEFGAWGHPVLDLVSARLGYPHSANAAAVPGDVVRAAEQAYRDAGGEADPADVTNACAHWALVRLGGLWEPILGPALTEPDATNRAAISQAMLVYEGFADVAETTGSRAGLAEAMRRVLGGLEDRLGVTPAPVFPAFGGERRIT